MANKKEHLENKWLLSQEVEKKVDLDWFCYNWRIMAPSENGISLELLVEPRQLGCGE